MPLARLGPACLALAMLLSGCAASPKESSVSTTPPAAPASAGPREMYVVATDSGLADPTYKFWPATFQARVGEPLNLTFKNAVGNLGAHSLVIDELNVKIQNLAVGDHRSLLVTPTKPGTFKYYCDQGNGAHRGLGMEGTLTVK